jgi:hypothetical protein
MVSHLPWIRPLMAADAPACDGVIASLPYHFGNADGRRECAEAVRSSAGLVAVEGGRALISRLTGELRDQGRRLLVLTVSSLEEEPGIDDGYHRTRAFYHSVGFVPARELSEL